MDNNLILKSTRCLYSNPLTICENSKYISGFKNIKDILKANMLAMESTKRLRQSINIETGTPASLLELAQSRKKI